MLCAQATPFYLVVKKSEEELVHNGWDGLIKDMIHRGGRRNQYFVQREQRGLYCWLKTRIKNTLHPSATYQILFQPLHKSS